MLTYAMPIMICNRKIVNEGTLFPTAFVVNCFVDYYSY